MIIILERFILMNHEWKYTTAGEAANTINLHDCIVTEWEHGDGYIALIFGGGFCVNDGNEHNRTGRHLLTGRSALVLRGGALISAEIPEYEVPKNGELEKRPAVMLTSADCDGPSIEVISWKYDAVAGNFFINGQLHRDIKGYRCPLINLCFSCKEVFYCWNDYTGDAWYEEHQRYLVIQETFKRFGFENHEVLLNKIIIKDFGSWTGKFNKFYALKHPESNIIYFIGRTDDNSGFAIKTAPGHAAAADNVFTVAATFADSINTTELKTLVEKWLEPRIN